VSKKLIVTDSRGDRELLLIGTMVVGRDPACDVSDADPLLSRRHAEFVAGARGVTVRDLGSRNGILVNGIKVGEGTLHPGDTIQIGHLLLRYVEDGAPLAAASEDGGNGDATAVISRASASHDDEKITLLRPPPSSITRSAPQMADDEKTLLVARPALGGRPEQVAPLRAPLPRERVPQEPPPQERRPQESRASRVFVRAQVAALAVIVFLATAIPLILWQGRIVNATAVSRASALVSWLAADAATALQTGGPIAQAADGVNKEPGVLSALVLSPEGRVLAPASRSAEAIDSIPSLGVKPGSVAQLQQAWNGDVIEVARPVQTKDRPRAAVAWITFKPSTPPETGSRAGVLALPAIITLVSAYAIATLIERHR